VREARLLCQAPTRAFTLIELLTVISIIAILTAIGLKVIKGVKERSSVGLAKVELAALSQALEMYKLQYGDYPQTGRTAATAFTAPVTAVANTSVQYMLFNALNGKLGPKLAALTNQKFFVDLARFSLFQTESANMPTAAGLPVENAFLDPWGQTYIYYYKTVGGATWTSPTYVLFSVGPDGEKADTDINSAGVVNYDSATMDTKNLDNIYANH
jgi:prepilin-type N-terminal cleavage/methylation domain-containing protein